MPTYRVVIFLRDAFLAPAGTFDQSGAPSLLDQYEYAMCTPPPTQHRSRQQRTPVFSPNATDASPRIPPARADGKLYKWKQDQPKAPVELYVSFGGLLMRLKGDARHLSKLSLDSRVYLLMRKIDQQ